MSPGDGIGGPCEAVPPTAGGVTGPVAAGFDPTGCGLPACLARSSARFSSYTPKETPAKASIVATTARTTATPVVLDRGARSFGLLGAGGAGGLAPAAAGNGPRAVGGKGPFAGA